MKNITLLNGQQMAAILLSLDDLRRLLESIAERATVAIPDDDLWDRDIEGLSLDEIF